MEVDGGGVADFQSARTQWRRTARGAAHFEAQSAPAIDYRAAGVVVGVADDECDPVGVDGVSTQGAYRGTDHQHVGTGEGIVRSADVDGVPPEAINAGRARGRTVGGAKGAKRTRSDGAHKLR